jgi:hypothetical protein
MSEHTVTVSQVLDPETGKAMAFEIVANDGKVYFVTTGGWLRGMRVGKFPNGREGQPLERVEIGRLER